MTSRHFDAARLDIDSLGNVTDLQINQIRKAELRRLCGLDTLPLDTLGLRWLSAPDLTVVPLPPGLRALSVWHSSKLKSLDGIDQAPRIETLELRENGKPLSLSALARLPKLRELVIDGGYGAGQSLVDLDGLDGLPIETLIMVNIDGADLDLGPIARLPNLTRLDLPPRCFSPESLAQIAAAKPWFVEVLQTLPPNEYAKRCKSCGGVRVEIPLRDERPERCPTCERDKIDAALGRLDDLIARA